MRRIFYDCQFPVEKPTSDVIQQIDKLLTVVGIWLRDRGIEPAGFVPVVAVSRHGLRVEIEFQDIDHAALFDEAFSVGIDERSMEARPADGRREKITRQ